MQKIKEKIFSLKRNYPDLFNSLFIEGKSIDKNEIFSPLVKAKFLFLTKERKLKSFYKIYFYNGLIFVNDFKNNEKDQVFSPYDEEVILCSKFYIPKFPKKVLEIGTGCGTYGVLAAGQDCKVVSIDVNPKAIKYAVLNARLNNVSKMIDYRCGDLFAPLKKSEHFDLIIASLPYLPTSRFADHHKRVYSDSGEEGNTLLFRTIREAHKFLSYKGMLKTYTMSLGDISRSIFEKNIQNITNQPWKVWIDYCYRKPWNFREWYHFKFPNLSEEEDRWLKSLSKKGLGFMHYIKIKMKPSITWSIKKRIKEYNRCIPYRR